VATDQYVIVPVATANNEIQGGPLLWDGTSPFPLGPGLKIITVEAARQGGYTWPARPATELNAATLRERVASALAENRAFLGRGVPTNAEILAQVRLLTKLTTAYGKLLLDQTDTTDGT